MARKNQYAVYVSFDNGWAEDCPDSESTFFGDDHGGEYFRTPSDLPEDPSPDANLGICGFVVVNGIAAARKLRDAAIEGGDWTVDGEERRPEYAIRKL